MVVKVGCSGRLVVQALLLLLVVVIELLLSRLLLSYLLLLSGVQGVKVHFLCIPLQRGGASF